MKIPKELWVIIFVFEHFQLYANYLILRQILEMFLIL